MSKIEKALSRAKRDNSLALVPVAKRSGDQQSGLAEPVTQPASGTGAMVEARSQAISGGEISSMREVARRSHSELADHQIIYPEMIDSETVQAFRELRTRILQKTNNRNGTIMITSVAGYGGSTFVTLNLGAVFAFDAGRTALLVDCNLRNPSFQRLFSGSPARGLTDYLENPDMDATEIIHSVGIERLRVIPAGEQHLVPTEYFTSPRMKMLFASLRQRYNERFVILDTPPMTESADTQILAELADYILVVVPYGKVTQAQVDECLQSVDAKKLLGVVFNNEPRAPNTLWMEAISGAVGLVQQSFRRARDSARRRFAQLAGRLRKRSGRAEP